MVILLQPRKTSYNVIEVSRLIQELKNKIIKQSFAIKKLAKAVQFLLAKVVVIELKTLILLRQQERRSKEEINKQETLVELKY